MAVWNIMDQKGFREQLKEAYFHGTKGAMCISDGTRADGLDSLDEWVSDLFDVAGRIIPTVILVNRKGKFCENVIEESAVAAKAKAHNASSFYTSPESRENVELAFQNLAERIVADHFQRANREGGGMR